MSEQADLRPIHQMVDALPVDGWWTYDRRERWLRGLEALVDWAIEVREMPAAEADVTYRKTRADDSARAFEEEG